MNDNFKNKMMELSKEINIKVTENQIEMYFNYMNLLLEWNEKINLTSITEQDDIIIKHFIDSMTVLKYIEPDKTIIDVGTGAGFPGIPISIHTQNQITLLDSLNKRIIFLEDVIKKLELKNVEAIHGRAEEYGQKNREKYDVAISRAVANLTTLSEYLIPLVKKDGIIICMKGPDMEQELKDAEFAIKELGGKIEKVDSMILPSSDIKRNIIIIRKKNETPKKYPRKAGMPSKDPLKK